MSLDDSPVVGDDGRPAGLIAIDVETTERVLAEREAVLEQEQQRLLQMPGFVALLRGHEHVYEYVNDADISICGPRTFIGRNVRTIFPDLTGQGFFERLDQVYATGEGYVARGRSSPSRSSSSF